MKQGYLLSPILFTFCIDSIKIKQTGISWSMREMLEALDFADDIVLLSYRHRGMKEKLTSLQIQQKKIGPKINNTKTKVMEITQNQKNPSH